MSCYCIPKSTNAKIMNNFRKKNEIENEDNENNNYTEYFPGTYPKRHCKTHRKEKFVKLENKLRSLTYKINFDNSVNRHKPNQISSLNNESNLIKKDVGNDVKIIEKENQKLIINKELEYPLKINKRVGIRNIISLESRINIIGNKTMRTSPENKRLNHKMQKERYLIRSRNYSSNNKSNKNSRNRFNVN